MSQILYLKMYLFHGNPKCKWSWNFGQLFPTTPLSSHGLASPFWCILNSILKHKGTQGNKFKVPRGLMVGPEMFGCWCHNKTTNYDRKLRTELFKCNYWFFTFLGVLWTYFFILSTWQDSRLFNLIVLVLISLLVTDSAIEWQDCYVGTETI